MNPDKVLNFINLLTGDRDLPAFKLFDDIFTQGNCGRFALILQEVFPEGKIVFAVNNGHALFEYKEWYYDINGKYSHLIYCDDNGKICNDEIRDITMEELEMTKNNYGHMND